MVLQVNIIILLGLSNFIYKCYETMGTKSHMAFVNRKIKGQFRVKRNRTIPLLFYGLISLLCMAHLALGDIEISEAQKKEAVYRLHARYKKDFPAVKDISPQQAIELLNQKTVVFVDTRKQAEMAISMVPYAVSKQDFLSHSDQYKDKTAVCYCTINKRSCVFAREMAKQGITVVNLKGGILAWILEGGKVYDKNGKEVKRVHVYSDKWNYAPAGYESIKFSLWERIF